ncbi:MAG: ABC transporter permease [bacterium]
MFKNYLKITFRNIFKFKVFTFINVTGLATGVAVCLLILMYVVNELSYDNFHKNKERIVRIAVEWGQEQRTMKFAGSMPALAPALTDQVPEVEKAVRIQKDYDAVFVNRAHERVKEENVFFADPQVFDIFSFHLLQGDEATALIEPFSVLLTESQTKKYFGDDDPLLQSLMYGDKPLKVTGVLADIPANTHLKCEFLVSYSTLAALGRKAQMPWNQWGDDLTYLLLKEHASLPALMSTLDDLLSKNAGEWFAARMKFIAQPLSDIHWELESRGDIGPKGNKMYVTLFLSAAIFVLLIACVNFMNLSTSRYLERMQEVGVRKVAGAKRGQLIAQFLTESFLMVIFAVFVGLVLFELTQSMLYSYLNSNIMLSSMHFKYLLAIVVGLVGVVGFLAGCYPALFMSKFQPVDIIKGRFPGESRAALFRKILVVAQFAISIILILGTLIIYRQLNFMKNTDLGFEKEDVLLIQFPSAVKEVRPAYALLRDEISKNPSVVDVSGAYTVPGVNSRMSISVTPEGSSAENSLDVQALPADYGFVSAMGLTIIDGRDLSKDFSLDEQESVLLNQTAVKALGLEKPVGTKLQIPGNERYRDVTVIGVVRDFHVQSLHHKVNPTLIYINPNMFILMALKIKPENAQQTIADIQRVWSGVLPDVEFRYKYMKDAYDNLYKQRTRPESYYLYLPRLLCLFLVWACLDWLRS